MHDPPSRTGGGGRRCALAPAGIRSGQASGVSNCEWYSPPTLVEAARRALGGIDCDPASCAEANRTVRAARYHSLDDDGLSQPWRGTVYLNPPWGRNSATARRPPISPKTRFVRKLAAHYRQGDVTAAVVVLSYDFSPQWFTPLVDHVRAICLLRDRVAFVGPGGGPRRSAQGTSVTYLGPDPQRFAASFRPLGLVVRPFGVP